LYNTAYFAYIIVYNRTNPLNFVKSDFLTSSKP